MYIRRVQKFSEKYVVQIAIKGMSPLLVSVGFELKFKKRNIVLVRPQ